MVYLLGAVALNAYIAIIFKWFERYKVDNLQTIIINYAVCVATGAIFLGRFPISAESILEPWAPWSALMGTLFISLFNIIAISTVASGITPTTVANKLSLVIPVAAAVLLYSDALPALKVAGIALALPAVYLSSRAGKDKDQPKKKGALLYPVLIFFGSGGLDTLVTWVTRKFLSTGGREKDLENQSVFLVHAFAVAAVIGAVVLTYMLATGRRKWAWRNVLAAVLLGVPNFFSIYFLLRLLHSGWLQPSAAIPVTNIGVVLIAGLCAIFLFGEKARPQRLLGLFLALSSIALILFAEIS